MTAAVRYVAQLEQLLATVLKEEMDAIRKAAREIARSFMNGDRLHVFGTGHSHMIAEEFFYRAGGLANVNPILMDGLMLHAGALQSTELERLSGLARVIFDQQQAEAGDVLIIASNSGRNAVNIEMAMLARERGLHVIALTSLAHSKSTTSRHFSGKLLYEVCDTVIDNHGCIGDASVTVEGFPRSVAPTSTVIGAAVVNAIVAETVEVMVHAGTMPEVFASSNADGGDRTNQSLADKYRGVIRAL
ncbi:SIS domain-containing protein [Paenibacillus silvisoli]|uniref:SIS domain-containing protein n=1 Tax=Paenibacillus silvisoli TaxID=3110539 RepID=UPI0028053C6F|nr:SIS domain-containing protein [Paenibacillus silvisoli]